jgi:hypothetical protein
MMIATVHDSVPIFLFSALGLVLCAAPALWARWTVRGSRRDLIAAAVLTAVLTIALIAGEQDPAWLLLPPAAVIAAIAARHHLGVWGRRVTGVLIVFAGSPLYILTLIGFALAVASIGCSPDAYECPL